MTRSKSPTIYKQIINETSDRDNQWVTSTLTHALSNFLRAQKANTCSWIKVSAA